MNLPFYIARRYLVSKKSHNIINIVSVISMVGVSIGTMALIIILSVFNGFDSLVVSLFSTFNAPFQVTAAKGKTFRTQDFPMQKLKQIAGVKHICEVIEAEALMKYKENQAIVTLKGVGEGYEQITGIDTMIIDGNFILQDGMQDFAVMGYGVAGTLGLSLSDYLNPVSVFVPNRESGFSGVLDQAFNTDVIFVSGVFQIQYEYDIRYVILPLRFVERLTRYEGERTSAEISIDPSADAGMIRKQIEATLGSGYTVKDRFQQQEILFRIMTSEKQYIFWILTLILIIATFNVIGTLSMLILDKKNDIAVLLSMGADRSLIRRIFFTEGLLISLIGAISGLLAGALICFLQMKYGFVRLGSADSSFVVSAYPVLMKFTDFLLVFFTVMVIGVLATLYPVYNIRKVDTTMTRTG